MNNKYLISFCNNSNKIDYHQGHGIIGLLKLGADGQLSYRDLPIDVPSLNKIKGATGLVKKDDKYYVVLQSAIPVLLVLDEQFNTIRHTQLSNLKGVHSICFFKDKLLMVSTRQDRIISLDLSDYSYHSIYDLETNSDTHHFNSICIHNGRVLASAFGLNKKEFWTQALSGYVIDINSGERIIEGLKQPHSLFSFKDNLFVCDSSRQRIVDKKLNIIASSDKGYVRGLWKQNGQLIFGISKGRSISNSTGKFIGNISNKGILAGTCQVVIQSNVDKKISINLDAFADEVYDIIQC